MFMFILWYNYTYSIYLSVYFLHQVVGSIGFLVGEGITCYNTMCQPWNLVFRGSCLAGWPVGHTSMMHTTSGWWFMRRCGIAELCINHLQFGNLNSDTFWMILQFQYPFCHCVVTSSRHVRQRIPRKPAPDTPLICLLLEALGLRGEAGPFDWLRTSGVTLWPGDLVCPQILVTFRVNALSFRASDLDSNQRQQQIALLVLYLPWCNLLFACQYGFNIDLGSDSFWFIARATSEPASLAQRGFQLEVWDFCWGTVGQFWETSQVSVPDLPLKYLILRGFVIKYYTLQTAP